MTAEKFKGGIGMTPGLGFAVPALYLVFTFYNKENSCEKPTSYVAEKAFDKSATLRKKRKRRNPFAIFTLSGRGVFV